MTKTWAPKVLKPRTVEVAAPPVPVRRMHVGAVDDPAEHEADAVAAHVIGPDDGEVDEHVHRGIERNRGHGAGLDGDVRRSMEHAFGGADFGDVRIHAGAESAELNDRLGAQAFTVGRDIFLGQSAPAPTSPGGRHLLAHELAHTLQDGAGARRSVVRRLVWNDPLAKITSIKVLGQGASGVVAKVSDGGTPVFVKADQEMSTESIVAGNMLREGKFKSGKFQVVAPRTRLARPPDLAELKAKSARPDVLDGDPRDFVKRLDGKHGTVIAEQVDSPRLKSRAEHRARQAGQQRQEHEDGQDDPQDVLRRQRPLRRPAEAAGDEDGDQVAVVRDDIRRLVDDNLSALRSATKTGLKSGRANVMKLLTNTLPLTSGLPAPLRREGR